MVKNIKGYFGNLKDFVILRGNRYMAKCCYEITNQINDKASLVYQFRLKLSCLTQDKKFLKPVQIMTL